MNVGRVDSAMPQPQGAKNDGLGNASLNMSDFFQLIAAELQNQSMYDTVDNAQFMAQMVQFSTLSQIGELTTVFRSNLAVSMIGKSVSATTVDDKGIEQTIVGEVEQVSYYGGTPYLMVNGGLYALSDVTDVGGPAPKPADTNG